MGIFEGLGSVMGPSAWSGMSGDNAKNMIGQMSGGGGTPGASAGGGGGPSWKGVLDSMPSMGTGAPAAGEAGAGASSALPEIAMMAL